jgi:predicted ester cyclase
MTHTKQNLAEEYYKHNKDYHNTDSDDVIEIYLAGFDACSAIKNTEIAALKVELDELKEWRTSDQSAIEHKDHEIVMLKKDRDELKAALEFECGDKCDAEYNPCNAREVLFNLNKKESR